MIQKYALLMVFATVLITNDIEAQSLKTATYNLRYDNPKDSLNSWKYRLPAVLNLIKYHEFEIFGTQEGLYHQLQDLKQGLPDFDYIGVGRDDGKQKGEHSAIFYNKAKFELLNSSNYWLSQNTNKPEKGWDADIIRICTWGEFKDKATGFSFFVFNVHFDHRGAQARKESAYLVVNKLKEIAKQAPAILMGDFNFSQKHENYALINDNPFLEDCYNLDGFKYAPSGTFNGFDINVKSEERIDHIFVTDAFKVRKYGILTDSYQGRLPSDHFPVAVELEIEKK